MRAKIAIIFTCFNRKKMSMRCIEHLICQNDENDLSFYICDDASTDGTFETIKSTYPNVNIVVSQGNLFWCKGMYYAMKMARKQHHDYYLMVNDDVVFFPDAIDTMLATYKKMGGKCGVVGMTISKETGNITYGGRKAVPFRFLGRTFGVKSTVLIEPKTTEDMEKCEFTNWNCFLIDSSIIDEVGLISNKYAHGFADFDYSYRMRKMGYEIYIAPTPIGFCEQNIGISKFCDAHLSKAERLKDLFSPKSVPFASFLRYQLLINGYLGIPIVIWRYFRFLICILLNKPIV